MYTALLLGCLKVFICRVADVTLGSFRTVLVVHEKNLAAGLIGFCEAFIWYMVVRDALNFEGSALPIAIAYALGYAVGTYTGGALAKRLVSGHVTVHVVTSGRVEAIPAELRRAGFGVTVLDVNGSEYGEAKHLILADLDKSKLESFEGLVKSLDPKAFLLVQETKQTLGGYRGQRK